MKFRSYRLPAVAGAVAIAAAAYLLLRPAEAPAPEPGLTPAAMAAPMLAPLPPAATPAPAAASTAGLQLRGVLGYDGGAGAAIFGLADGRQRLVAVGREVMPGVRLDAIAVDRATVHDGVQLLEFILPELQAGEGAAPVPVAVAADPKRDLANFRLGLKPEGDAERPHGYRIAAGVPLPALQRAGLQPGDVVLAVNGQTLDEERLLELPAELAAASSVEIDYERDGKRLTATLPAR